MLGKYKLNGRVALVTGSSQGLGQGMAFALGQAGANVCLVARKKAGLEETARLIEESGGKAYVLPADVSKISEAERIVKETIAHFGRIDILLNSVGAQARKPALEVVEEDWNYVTDVLLKSVYFVTQAAASEMAKVKKGKIINIASLTTFIGLNNVSIYGACKGGIASLTRHWAIEWAKYNINVNAIAPGYFKTAQTAAVFNDPVRGKWILDRIPLGRSGDPEDLAGAVVFFASDASDYITGQILSVDGGWLAG